MCCAVADGTCAHDYNIFPLFSSGPFRRISSYGKGFYQHTHVMGYLRRLHDVKLVTFIIFREKTVFVNTHKFLVGADVDLAVPARIAGTADQLRLYCNEIAGEKFLSAS